MIENDIFREKNEFKLRKEWRCMLPHLDRNLSDNFLR